MLTSHGPPPEEDERATSLRSAIGSQERFTAKVSAGNAKPE
jgi:hypothetical protein